MHPLGRPLIPNRSARCRVSVPPLLPLGTATPRHVRSASVERGPLTSLALFPGLPSARACYWSRRTLLHLHRIADQGGQWWTSYQPVSYQISSKHGDRAAFAGMVSACQSVGVGIIVDTVLNRECLASAVVDF